MQAGAERQLTSEQAQEVLSNEARKLHDGFNEVLMENQAFKDALAGMYLKGSDLGILFVQFTHGDFGYSFTSEPSGEFMRIMKYDATDEVDIEDLDIDCRTTDPIISYRQKTDDVWGEGCVGLEAVGPAQKMLEGLKPEEKS